MSELKRKAEFENDEKIFNQVKKKISKRNPQREKEELNFLMAKKNWEITSYVSTASYRIAFSDMNKRLEFMRNLLMYNETIVSEYDRIESLLPTDNEDPEYFIKQTWKDKTLKGPTTGAIMSVNRLKKEIAILESNLLDY
jgi:hypothetical protein